MKKICEYCGKEFEVEDSIHGRKRRFCNTSCSAKWRNKTFGPNKLSEEAKKQASAHMKELWKNAEFRSKKIEYMHTNNPVYMDGIVEKAKETRLKNGSYYNNFKYGNGKISPHEQILYDFLLDLGFYYNYAISTKLARDAFPNEKYPCGYKPDFVNIKKKLCIEIDGNDHFKKKDLDNKKDACLNFLGFTVIRYTHEQLDNNEILQEIKEEIKSYVC